MEVSANSFAYKNIETKKENTTSINNQSKITTNEIAEDYKTQKKPLVTAKYVLSNHLAKNPVIFGKSTCNQEYNQLVDKYKKEGEKFAELKAFIEYKKQLEEECACSNETEIQKVLAKKFNVNFDFAPILFSEFSISTQCNAKIHDSLLMKFICVDKISEFSDIVDAYNNYLKSAAEKLNLFNGDDICTLDNNMNLSECLDENCLPVENKIILMKKLYSISQDLIKVDTNPSHQLYYSSAAIKIMQLANNNDKDIEKITNEILPKLGDKDNKDGYYLIYEIEKLLKSKNSDLDLKVIEFLRKTTENGEYYDTEFNVHSEEELNLYSSIYDLNYTLADTKDIVNSKLSTEDKINFAKTLSGTKRENFYGCSTKGHINNLRDFLSVYEKICASNDEEKKADFLNKIEFLKDKKFTDRAIYTIISSDEKKYKEIENKILKRYEKLFTNEPLSEENYGGITQDLVCKYMEMNDEMLDVICKTIAYFTDNIDKLQQHDEEEFTKGDLALALSLYAYSIIDITAFIGQDGMNSAVELKMRRLGDLLESVKTLEDLQGYTEELLQEKLNQLPHPRQKLDKLFIVSSLIGETDVDTLNYIIMNIKSPKMTERQKDLANEIFADKTKNYNEQIEEFITKFNVPEEKKDTIRKFLIKADLQNKYRQPQSYEKQMQIIDTKIAAIIRNNKIPQDKKEVCLKVLNKQKRNLIKNPEKYTKPRIDDNTMKNLSSQVEAHINTPNNEKEFNKLLKTQLYELLNIEANDNLLNNLNYDDKYFSCLFSGLSQRNFKEEFKKLIELIKANPDKKLSEILKTIPTNNETEKLFKSNGLNYNKWINFDENSKLDFTVEVDVEKSLKAVKENLIKELNSELAKKLDKTEIEKLMKITTDMNIENAGQKNLPKIIKAIEEYIKTSEYWQNNEDGNIKEFKDHVNIHKNNIKNIEKLKNTKEELSVRLWNRNDIERNLFFGNHVGCCTSIGSCNSFAAVQHLMNTFVNGIEIVDKTGNSMGNSMCYFANIDGKLTFVIDSFEANGKLGASEEVTDAIVEYAKQLCKQMGREDAKIMFGPNYNKIDLSKFTKTQNHTIEIIGKAPNETYIDAVIGDNGTCNVNEPAQDREMYEMTNK